MGFKKGNTLGFENRFKADHVPWFKGLTKEADERVKRLKRTVFSKSHTPWNKGLSGIRGHASWNKGLTKDTDKRVKKQSEAIKGKPLSEETRRKISIILQGHIAWNKGLDGFNKGKIISVETRELLKESNKGQVPWNKNKTDVYPEETIQRMANAKKGKKYALGHVVSEEARKELREKRLLQIFPVKDTKIEVAVQDELKKRGIIFKKHIPFFGMCQPDIVIPKLRKIIQCDGDYWHRLPNRAEQDQEQDAFLKAKGWTVHRLWEHEINQDVKRSVNRVFLGRSAKR